MNFYLSSHFLQNKNLNDGYNFFKLPLENFPDIPISLFYLKISIILIFLFLLLRAFRVWRFKNLLNKTYQINSEEIQEWSKQPEKQTQKDNQNYQGSVLPAVSVSCVDTIFHWTQIDPNVLNAIDRAHGRQAFESYKALRAHVNDVIERGPESAKGLINQYKGYTGEEQVIDYLRMQGHHVENPESPNQEGYDAIVDGQKIQIKSGLSPAGIKEHQERFPEYPVFTVEEHEALFGQNDNVTALPLSGEKIETITQDTLEGIHNQESALGEFPLITAITSGGKNLHRLYKGHMKIGEALKFTATDVAGVGTGGAIGGGIGTAFGVLGGPFGMVVGEVIGVYIGAYTGRKVANWFKGKKIRKALEELEKLFPLYPELYAQALQSKSRALLKQAKQIKKARKGIWLWPNLSYMVRTKVAKRYKEWSKECQQVSQSLLEDISSMTELSEKSDLAKEIFSSEEFEPAYSKNLGMLRTKISGHLNIVIKEKKKLG